MIRICELQQDMDLESGQPPHRFKIRALHVQEDFVFWRRECMGWHTPEELRLDEAKRAQSRLSDEKRLHRLDLAREQRRAKRRLHSHPLSPVLTHSFSPVLIRFHPVSPVLTRSHPLSPVFTRSHPFSLILLVAQRQKRVSTRFRLCIAQRACGKRVTYGQHSRACMCETQS